MVTLMIIDDEDFIRQGIHYTIPWEENGIAVIGEASEGQEALQLMREKTPDIILADIQMPVMSGLELAEKVCVLFPDTQVIILTAYSDTEYLKAAINTHVLDYVMKSADSKVILSSVLKARDLILKKREQRNQDKKIRSVYQENRQLLKTTLFSRLFSNSISQEHFLSQAEKLDITIPETSCTFMLLDAIDENDQRIFSYISMALITYSPFSFRLKGTKIIVILDTSEKSFSVKDMAASIPLFLPYLKSKGAVVMTDVPSVFNMPQLMPYMEKAMNNLYWENGSSFSFINSSDLLIQNDRTDELIYTYEAAIIRDVSRSLTLETTDAIDKYYAYCQKNMLPKEQYLNSIERILVSVYAITNNSFNITDTLRFMKNVETPEECISVLRDLTDCTRDNQNQKSSIPIEPALDYIRSHYSENLHLDDVASKVFLSPGYLCRIFKEITGYSFKEYLHQVRIEKARELIRTTDRKIYEISEEVGYSNYKYFSTYFSKITGYSATEYARRCKRNDPV